ncbi:MAG: cell envelope integrity protein CreD [Proteobacteria bacterium]|nr:cell envelope integrity protein CreD [Pseudomonadota bacterium]
MKWDNFKNSNTFRVLFIGFLILLFLIPMSMVESVIFERSHLYRQATNEITKSWGKAHLMVGPILTLPYSITHSNSGWPIASQYKHHKPDSMIINTDIETQIRYRGIYEVPVYTTTIHVTGIYNSLIAGNDYEKNNLLNLDEGIIQIPVQQNRSIKKPIQLTWNGEEIHLTPERDDAAKNIIIFTGILPSHLLNNDQVHKFEYDMVLAGSESFSFISPSKHTIININSNWTSPGFYGSYLPSKRDITDEGFNARWEINDLNFDISHQENRNISFLWFNNEPEFGVKLIQPVDTYQTVTRAAKYAVLFISLTFLVYFFTELFGRVQLHPIQYLFVGVANCVFYLLLLSLAEHIIFSTAYFISSIASIILISLYSKSILKSCIKAGIVFLVLSGLYTYLFVTLRSEGFALIIGSFGLFIILGISMYLTRNIDWNKMGTQSQEA